jgi:hypothetical protein
MPNRSKEIEPVFACVVDASALTELDRVREPMRDDVWLSKTCQCARHSLVGVPSKRVDLLVDHRLLNSDLLHPKEVLELTVVRKVGRFDGSKRDRLTLRVRPGHACRDHERCVVRVIDQPSLHRIDVTTDLGVVRWTRQYDRLRSDLAEYDPGRLVMWHWARYYQHLEHAIAESVAAEWSLTDWAQHSANWTLAEANRSASRALYRASRDSGFRKMTLRERLRLGMSADSGQWHRVDHLPTADGPTSGCGQATIEAAAGKDVQWNGEDDLYDVQERMEQSA